MAGGGDRHRPAGPEPALRRTNSTTTGLHRRADAQPALRGRRNLGFRAGHGGLHPDVVGHLHHRLRDGVQRAVRHGPNAFGGHRRRGRHALLVDRRHVVDHPDRHGAVRPQDHRGVLSAAAVHLAPGRRIRRYPRPRRRRRVQPDVDRHRHDHHVLRRLQLRNADRTGHLATGVHRPLTAGRPLGRHDSGDLLRVLRNRRRTDRSGRVHFHA